MSFKFHWPCFDLEFYRVARNELEKSLNKGSKPANICDVISVKELDMGNIPPELDILEIAELTTKRFKGIFKLVYNGDAYLVLQTKIQANPVTPTRSQSADYGILAANKPLIVPMQLKISHFKLNGIVTLVICKERGVTCCFKNDPLESVKVSSTFDSTETIRRYLQMEIENRLCELFREELPAIIHQFSLQKLSQSDNHVVPINRDWRKGLPNRWNSVTPTILSVNLDFEDLESISENIRETKSEGNSVDGEQELFYLKSAGIIHRTISDQSDLDLFEPYIRRESFSLKKSKRPSRSRSSTDFFPTNPTVSNFNFDLPDNTKVELIEEVEIDTKNLIISRSNLSAIFSSQYTLSPYTRPFISFISRSMLPKTSKK